MHRRSVTEMEAMYWVSEKLSRTINCKKYKHNPALPGTDEASNPKVGALRKTPFGRSVQTRPRHQHRWDLPARRQPSVAQPRHYVTVSPSARMCYLRDGPKHARGSWRPIHKTPMTIAGRVCSGWPWGASSQSAAGCCCLLPPSAAQWYQRPVRGL